MDKELKLPVRHNGKEVGVKGKSYHTDLQKFMSGRMDMATFKKKHGG